MTGGENAQSEPLGAGRIAKAFEGWCPYCNRGPYKSLATHTSGAHGINSRQLKDDLGVTYETPLCSPELSQRYRDRPNNFGGKPNWRKPRDGWSKPQGSRAAVQSWRENIEKARSDEATQRGLEAMHRPEAYAKNAAARTKNPEHGSVGRYEKGCRCDACRVAKARQWAKYQAEHGRKVMDRGPAQHGSRSKYDGGCRCDSCRSANTEAMRKYRARKRRSS